MFEYRQRLKCTIPGGAHTYSKGSDQFPDNAPEILCSGLGSYVYDTHNRPFLDFGMGLRSVTLGYANSEVNEAAFNGMLKGNNLSLPSILELEAAERLAELIPSIESVKFTKNGSAAVSAAVKLARAYTGRSKVLYCQEHPFFSFDDWFIGSTVVPRGVPQETRALTLTFPYNDIDTLSQIINQQGQEIACVVMEPMTVEEPKVNPSNGLNFLQEVQALCHAKGVLFILDEMITGFRWHLRGAQSLYQVYPDLSTFGKAMGNGFSVAALGGRKNIMDLGGIDDPDEERVFLLSTTHGAEMCGLSAFLKVVDIYERDDVITQLWNIGKSLRNRFQTAIDNNGLQNFIKILGPDCSPIYETYNAEGKPDLNYKTLLMQGLADHQILMPYIALSTTHSEEALDQFYEAISHSMAIYAKAINFKKCERFLQGSAVKPVFRPFN